MQDHAREAAEDSKPARWHRLNHPGGCFSVEAPAAALRFVGFQADEEGVIESWAAGPGVVVGCARNWVPWADVMDEAGAGGTTDTLETLLREFEAEVQGRVMIAKPGERNGASTYEMRATLSRARRIEGHTGPMVLDAVGFSVGAGDVVPQVMRHPGSPLYNAERFFDSYLAISDTGP